LTSCLRRLDSEWVIIITVNLASIATVIEREGLPREVVAHASRYAS
jgi:hypothetical protein